MLQFNIRYIVDRYVTFDLLARSGNFQGEAHFCVSLDQLRDFAQAIKNIDCTLTGKAILGDTDSDAYISIEGVKHGHVVVSGQIGGTHEDHFVKFKFYTDQTTLGPFQRQVYQLSQRNEHA